MKANDIITMTITKTALTIAIVTLLTGCAATNSSSALLPTSKPAATATETAAPTVLKTGDLVAEADVQTILKAGNGQRAYQMADGTFIVVTKTEPLPVQVQADANAKAASVAAAYPDASASLNALGTAIFDVAGKIEASTGKRVITVWKLYGYADFSESKSTYWSVIGLDNNVAMIYSSHEEAQAVAEAGIAARSNPAEYALVFSD